ncbi:MAG: hypothetical protein U0354_04845 [Candidatus Sericytochromatia bacterium]
MSNIDNLRTKTLEYYNTQNTFKDKQNYTVMDTKNNVSSAEAEELIKLAVNDDGQVTQEEVDAINGVLKEKGSKQSISLDPNTMRFTITGSNVKYNLETREIKYGSTSYNNLKTITEGGDKGTVKSYKALVDNYKKLLEDKEKTLKIMNMDMDDIKQKTNMTNLVKLSLGIKDNETDPLKKSMLNYNVALLEKRDNFFDKYFSSKPELRKEFNEIIYTGADPKKLEDFVNKLNLSPTQKLDFIVYNPDMTLSSKKALLTSKNIGELKENITSKNQPTITFSNPQNAENYVKDKMIEFNDNLVKELRTKGLMTNDVRVAGVGDGSQTKGLANVPSLGIGMFAYGNGNTINNTVPILTPADKELSLNLNVQGLESVDRKTNGDVAYKDKSGKDQQLFFTMGVDNNGQSTITFFTDSTRKTVLPNDKLPEGVTFNNGEIKIDTQKSSKATVNLQSVNKEDAEVQISTNGKIVPQVLDLKDYYISGSYVLDIKKLQSNQDDKDAYLYLVNNLKNQPNIDNAISLLNLSGEGVNDSAEKVGDLGENQKYRKTTVNFGDKFTLNSSTDGENVLSFVQKNPLPKPLVDAYPDNKGYNNDVLSAMRTLELAKQTLFDAGYKMEEINTKSVTINVNGKNVTINLGDIKPDPLKKVIE